MIDRRNAKSSFHRALHISYPTPQQSEAARRSGYSPGRDITIHGLRNGTGFLGPLGKMLDWTNGCIAVTDEEMDQIWAAIRDGAPVEIRP